MSSNFAKKKKKDTFKAVTPYTMQRTHLKNSYYTHVKPNDIVIHSCFIFGTKTEFSIFFFFSSFLKKLDLGGGSSRHSSTGVL